PWLPNSLLPALNSIRAYIQQACKQTLTGVQAFAKRANVGGLHRLRPGRKFHRTKIQFDTAFLRASGYRSALIFLVLLLVFLALLAHRHGLRTFRANTSYSVGARSCGVNSS